MTEQAHGMRCRGNREIESPEQVTIQRETRMSRISSSFLITSLAPLSLPTQAAEIAGITVTPPDAQCEPAAGERSFHIVHRARHNP